MKNDREDIRISAVIPAYNAEKYISRAIESVLKQSRPADEIIVVDDGSTDKTGEIVQTYGGKVRYIRQENAGASEARNRGIEEASCEWTAFLDADDEWLEDNLKLQIEVLERNRRLAWVFGNFYNHYSDTNVSSPAHHKECVKDMPDGKDYFEDYLDCYVRGYYASPIAMLIQRDVLLKAGGFAVEYARGEDTDLLLRVAYIEPAVGYVPEPISIYHRSVANSLSKSDSSCKIIGDIVEKHLEISARFGKRDKFEKCGRVMLSVWMRQEFCRQNAEDILQTIKRFEWLLDWRFKAEIRLRARHPRIAPYCLAMTSCIKKFVRSVKKILRLNKG